jgi:hypothetical protein
LFLHNSYTSDEEAFFIQDDEDFNAHN